MNVIVKDIIHSEKGYSYLKLTPETILKLGLENHDCVEVKNQNSNHFTAAILYEEKTNGLDSDQVMISWYASQNLAATLGDLLSLRKIYPRVAKFLQMTEINKQVSKLHNIEQLSEKLQQFTLTRGDLISFRYKNNTVYTFMVVKYAPECDAVIIRENTKIKIGY